MAIHPGGVATGLLGGFLGDHPWVERVAGPVWRMLATGAEVGAWGQCWAVGAEVGGFSG